MTLEKATVRCPTQSLLTSKAEWPHALQVCGEWSRLCLICFKKILIIPITASVRFHLDPVLFLQQQPYSRFDVETRHAFVGDQSGQVTILKLEQDSCNLVTTFKGHTGTQQTKAQQTPCSFGVTATEAAHNTVTVAVHNGRSSCNLIIFFFF